MMLREYYQDHQGKVSDKWSSYLSAYQRLFAPLRKEPVRLLEIGIQNGGSLEIWNRYFSAAEKLVGCDINPDCVRLHFDDPRIAVVVGDVNTDASERQIASLSADFDIILDDGSHRSSDIVRAFARYFPRLKDNGLYVVEDLHCSYWQEYEGGLFYPYSAIAFFKRLVDIINHAFWGADKTPATLVESFARFYGVVFDGDTLTRIHSIEFINSVCVIRKRPVPDNLLGQRLIAGCREDVVKGVQSLHRTEMPVPPQTGNPWADRPVPLEEELPQRLAELAEVKERLAESCMETESLTAQLAELYRELDHKREEIAALQRLTTERTGQIADLQRTTAAREGQIIDLQRLLAEREGEFARVLASESWRITAPLRFAGRQGRRVRNLVRTVPYLLRQGGGLSASAQKAYFVYRREGWAGVRARLRRERSFAVPAAQPSPFGNLNTAIGFEPETGYLLKHGAAGYTYIPPAKPVNLREIVDGLRQPPVFSILVPVYDTPPELLERMVDSVRAQWYPRWQLILADDASPSPATREALIRISHPQITVFRLESNQGIAGATNAALAKATGEFVVLLDHDDELTDDCLFELARCIDRDQPDYIYSDEDKIAPDGRFTEPHFKPDWSPDTLMSTMYVCHVSCIRRRLLVEVGGFRPDYDGCQDWDVMLRVVERTTRIRHIPKVLYHWRIIPASTASDIAAKPYVLAASQRVREEALRRRGLAGTVEAVPQVKGYFRVNYHLQGAPLISIVIPSRDNAEILRRCIDSIFTHSSYGRFEVILLDNGSAKPETLVYLEELGREGRISIVRHDRPFNFSELNNVGSVRARGDILLFLNDDTEVISPDWLERMGGYAQLPHIGAVGAKLLYPGGRQIQHAGIINLADGPGHAFLHLDANTPGYYLRNLLEYNWLAVTGACLMIERDKFQAIGGFDESFPVAYNDVDLCLRLRDAGFYNVVCQAARLIHHESVSRGIDHLSAEKNARLQREKRVLFERHPFYYQHDPFHSPNLHPNGIHFELPL